MNYDWPTSRRFPRSEREAFKDHPENAQWWYPPEKNVKNIIVRCIGVALWIAIAIYFWKTR